MQRSTRSDADASRRGAALPFALLALLFLTLLATGLMLSSSTEALLGRAHREATAEVYAAEGAVHAWIAAREHHLAPDRVPHWVPPGGTLPVQVTVERVVGAGALGPSDRSALYSVQAEPADGTGGGRAMVALVRARQVPLPDLAAHIDAPVVAGENSTLATTVAGSVVVRDGYAHPLCSAANSRAGSGWILARHQNLLLQGGAQLDGGVTQSTEPRDALLQQVLGGIGIRDLAWNAERRFGRYFHEPPLPAGQPIHSGSPDPRLDWGCPVDVIDGVRASAAPGFLPPPCASAADTAAYPVIAIDAENQPVVLDGHHGQGIVIVINGPLRIGERFVFKGLLIAERDVLVTGGGPGWEPSIEGAIVAGGQVVIQGGAAARSVRFNRCAIDRAQAAFNGPVPGQWGRARVLGRPFGWAEVLR